MAPRGWTPPRWPANFSWRKIDLVDLGNCRAVAASLLTAVYHMLKDGTFHQDLGADYLVKRDKARIAARLAKRIN
jgi:hypothetical protein